MRLLVGLGNPGADYADTRHNIGCWVIERAAARWSIRLTWKGAAQRGSGRAGSKLVELASTLDWMNLSGPPLKGLLRELGLTPEALVVVQDDVDEGSTGARQNFKLVDWREISRALELKGANAP